MYFENILLEPSAYRKINNHGTSKRVEYKDVVYLNMKRFFVFTLLGFFQIILHAQAGKIIRFQSGNAMFPDTGRVHGHVYNGKHYSLEDS